MNPRHFLQPELLRLIKERNLEFGVIVRRLTNPQLAFTLARSRTIVFQSVQPGSLPIESPLEAVKVFPDGREEPVRNLNVAGLTLGDFRNILAVSEPSTVYTAPVRICGARALLAGRTRAARRPDYRIGLRAFHAV